MPARTPQCQNKIRSGRYHRRPRPRRVSHTYTHFSREGGGRRTWMLILAAASIPYCCYYTGLGSAACLSVCLCVPSFTVPVRSSPRLHSSSSPAWLPALTTPPPTRPPRFFFLPWQLASHLPRLRLPRADVLTLDKQNQTPSRLAWALPVCQPPPSLH